MNGTKAYKGVGMNGLIAGWYDKIKAKDIDGDRASARRVAEFLPEGGRILEIAPGPGYEAIELAKLGEYEIVGMDISGSMVRIATEKAADEGVDVRFCEGDAARMPFPEDAFDLVYCRAAFKNFSRPVEAIREMYRVLKPGGVALIEDLRPDLADETIASYVREAGLGPLDALLTTWAFKRTLTKRAHPRAELERMVAGTQFATCDIAEDPWGYEVELWKDV